MKKLRYILFVFLMMMILPFGVMASENKVYLDKSIGGTTSWDSINGYDYRYSLKEYLGNNSMSISDVKKIVFNDILSTDAIYGGYYVDISRDKDISVLAILDGDTLYIQYKGTLYLNPESDRLFAELTNVTSITGLEYVNTSEVIDMSSMFQDSSSITSLDLSGWDVSKVKVMHGMFFGMRSLENINLSSWDTSNVEYMGYMFYDVSSMVNLDLSNFKTTKLKYVSYMFYGMKSLKNINLTGWDTSSFFSMDNMFNYCSSMVNLDLSSFDTSSVTSMSHLFSNMTSLKKLNISNFNTSNVEDMSYMFYKCSSLTNIDLSKFNVQKVSNMDSMFYGCSSLKELDLSGFYTPRLQIIVDMFKNATSLEKVYVSDKWYISRVDKSKVVFGNNTNLVGFNGTKYDESKNTGWYAEVDTNYVEGYFSVKMSYSSEVYDLTKDYIFVGIDEIDLSKINVVNGEVKIEKDNLNIYHGELLMKSIKLVKVVSDVYDVSNQYVYTKNENIDVNNVTVTNGKSVIENDKLNIYYGEELIKSYDIVNYSSDSYDVYENIIYTGSESLDVNKINIMNGTSKVNGNYLDIYYGDKKLDSISIVTISSDKYKIYPDYIYIDSLTVDASKIYVTNGNVEYINRDTIQIKSGNLVLDEIMVRSSILGVSIKDSEEVIIKLYGQANYLLMTEVDSLNTLDDQTLTWSSSDTNIAKVDKTGSVGNVVPVSPGIVTITVTTSNGKTDSVKVIVRGNEVPVSSSSYREKYDGEEHSIELKIEIPEKTKPYANIKILYSTDGKNYNLTDMPKYRVPGSYRVYYKVTSDVYSDSYGDNEVVIVGIISMASNLKIKDKFLIINNYDNSLYRLMSGINLYALKEYDEYRYDGGIFKVEDGEDYLNQFPIMTGKMFEISLYSVVFPDYLYEIVLRGDLSGDGDVDSLDLATMMNHISGKKELMGAHLEAAYLNNDEDIDSLDLAYLMNHIAGKEGY